MMLKPSSHMTPGTVWHWVNCFLGPLTQSTGPIDSKPSCSPDDKHWRGPASDNANSKLFVIEDVKWTNDRVIRIKKQGRNCSKRIVMTGRRKLETCPPLCRGALEPMSAHSSSSSLDWRLYTPAHWVAGGMLPWWESPEVGCFCFLNFRTHARGMPWLPRGPYFFSQLLDSPFLPALSSWLSEILFHFHLTSFPVLSFPTVTPLEGIASLGPPSHCQGCLLFPLVSVI